MSRLQKIETRQIVLGPTSLVFDHALEGFRREGVTWPVIRNGHPTTIRVMAIHAPTAALSITAIILALNRGMALGVSVQQIVVLWALIGFVGVGHAVLEYFF